MPILEDFKPDLIVNSAGQDNHYSDPITNMNFSAQGYAELTKMLKPDIAVLEGGYAIEGALPYVNVGIILAMAGIDFSKVKEPDYNPDRIRQSREVTDYIKKTAEAVMTIWNQRDAIEKEFRQKGKVQERSRSLFYDTDNIREEQKETLMVCNDCAGAYRIESPVQQGQQPAGGAYPARRLQGLPGEGVRMVRRQTPRVRLQAHAGSSERQISGGEEKVVIDNLVSERVAFHGKFLSIQNRRQLAHPGGGLVGGQGLFRGRRATWRWKRLFAYPPRPRKRTSTRSRPTVGFCKHRLKSA